MTINDKSNLKTVFTYTGQPLAESTKIICTKVGNIKGGQDGAIYDGLMFRFDANGTGQVYSMESFIQTAEIRLEKTKFYQCILTPSASEIPFMTQATDFRFYTAMYTTIIRPKMTAERGSAASTVLWKTVRILSENWFR